MNDKIISEFFSEDKNRTAIISKDYRWIAAYKITYKEESSNTEMFDHFLSLETAEQKADDWVLGVL
jgi:hypothetical protein